MLAMPRKPMQKDAVQEGFLTEANLKVLLCRNQEYRPLYSAPFQEEECGHERCKRDQEMWLLVPALSNLTFWWLSGLGAVSQSNERIKISHYIWAWTHSVTSV